jgi:predicted RNase H-like HicB family nuclease
LFLNKYFGMRKAGTWYGPACPVVPGCLSQGKTKEEALENIQEAIQLSLEVRQQEGLAPMIQSLEVEIPAQEC